MKTRLQTKNISSQPRQQNITKRPNQNRPNNPHQNTRYPKPKHQTPNPCAAIAPINRRSRQSRNQNMRRMQNLKKTLRRNTPKTINNHNQNHRKKTRTQTKWQMPLQFPKNNLTPLHKIKTNPKLITLPIVIKYILQYSILEYIGFKKQKDT